MTFLTTRPPDLKLSPRPLTPRKPRKWSRAAPALIRRGPERLQARTPPSVRLPTSVSGIPKQRAPIGRLEGEHLPRLCERGLDFAERRRCAGGQYQLARLIFADAGQPGQVERVRQLQRPAEPAFRAAGDDLHRLLGGERVADRIAQFIEVCRGETDHRRKLSLPAQRSNLAVVPFGIRSWKPT